MPERAEILVQHNQIKHFIHSTPASDRHLRALWVDATTEEQSTAPPGTPARAGLVYSLPPGAILRRGQKRTGRADKSAPTTQGRRRRVASNVQDNEKGFAVYPYWLARDLSSATYVLERSHFNPHALIFEFNDSQDHSLYVDIRLYLHVSVQIFTSSEWHRSVCKVPRTVRGFKVAVAFDLGPYVVALLSHDLLFHIHWATSLARLPSANISDVLIDWPGFLRDVAWWIQKRRLRLSLSEHELFDNASRTARLCVAYWSFARHCEDRLWPYVKRYLHGFKFAVERSDRLFYGRFLKVYSKQLTWIHARHGRLLDLAIRAAEDGDILKYDSFEPGLVASALRMPQTNLGHLIFGRDWPDLSMRWGIDAKRDQDPDGLTALYKAFMWTEKTYLPPGQYYIPDGLNGGEIRARRFPTIMYRLSPSPCFVVCPTKAVKMHSTGREQKRRNHASVDVNIGEDESPHRKARTFQAWSVIPGNLTHCNVEVQSRVAVVSEKSRLAYTLVSRITGSHTYSVGPMDFCGIARLERAQGKGRPMIPPSACSTDAVDVKVKSTSRPTSVLHFIVEPAGRRNGMFDEM
ncbi:hypothetical protein FKP32DRAFT_1674150 [Trametes sanguinea]|nr:hypothetical protein FKP32DRAFT_1674150 [Trametes sanguinea]